MATKQLTGKIAWVTGSSRGIGRVIAEHLARCGAAVAIHGTTPTSTRAFGEADSLKAVAQDIAAASGVQVLPVTGDLSNEATVKNATSTIRGEFGRIDILVNCAGGDIGAQGTKAPGGGKPKLNNAIDMAYEDIKSVLDRNLMTCILVSREVATEMMQRKSGCIVNFGSISGLYGHGESAIYGTAKAAVHEYSRCLAMMLREYNVRVNAVAPGDIVTARFVATRTLDESMLPKDGTLVRYGTPEEIAHMVEYLVTDNARYITGQVIRIDGGKQCWPS